MHLDPADTKNGVAIDVLYQIRNEVDGLIESYSGVHPRVRGI